MLALKTLREQPWSSATEAKRKLVDTYKSVASRLRNTPAVCKKCYVHPTVVETYLAGSLTGLPPARPRTHLSADEVTFLRMLAAARTPQRAGGRAARRSPRRKRAARLLALRAA